MIPVTPTATGYSGQAHRIGHLLMLGQHATPERSWRCQAIFAASSLAARRLQFSSSGSDGRSKAEVSKLPPFLGGTDRSCSGRRSQEAIEQAAG